MLTTGFPITTVSAICLWLGLAAYGGGPPSIQFNSVPAWGSFDNLTGRVKNVSVGDHRVAVLIFLPGLGWYSKPTCAGRLTPIAGDGSWSADITTGGADERATCIAAFLVPATFNEPCVEGLGCIPDTFAQQSLAHTTALRQNPALPTIRFSGLDWIVKTSTGVVGPGPNHFSASTNNVWVDDRDRLHLRITHTNSQWRCAEVVSKASFGYGTYSFLLETPPTALDPQVVLGFFTWSDDCAFARRELDIEFSRWGDADDTNNAQFVVQPYDLPGHQIRFSVPPTPTNSTHRFRWHSTNVFFESFAGGEIGPGSLIQSWTHSLAVPQRGDENVRFNLWLYAGTPPTDGNETEVILSQFQFLPAYARGDVNASASVTGDDTWLINQTLVGLRASQDAIFAKAGFANGDINRNGSVSGGDSLLINQALAGLRPYIVTDILPASHFSNQTTAVTIYGIGFPTNVVPTIAIGAPVNLTLTNVVLINHEQITAIVPPGGGLGTGLVTFVSSLTNAALSFGRFINQ